jgi:transposase-like protein
MPTEPQPKFFKYRHFEASLILLCVRRYLRYSLSYRDLEEMMIEEEVLSRRSVSSGKLYAQDTPFRLA